MIIKSFRWSVIEFLSMWIPPFHCCASIVITHEWYFLCSFLQMIKIWCDGIYVTPKFSELINARTFIISCKMWWGVVQCAVEFVSIDFSGCFRCTLKVIFTLITVKESFSNHVMYTLVAAFITIIYPWWIYTSSL